MGKLEKVINKTLDKHKDNPMEDLQKAKWYIERMIQQLERTDGSQKQE